MAAGEFLERESCRHNDEFECAGCATARHLDAHPSLEEPGCRVCKFAGTIQLSPKATPSKKASGAPKGGDPAWERGIVKDHRGVPLMRANGTEIGVKEYAENRSTFEEAKRRRANDPNAFASTKE
jgi:hypothetical protein